MQGKKHGIGKAKEACVDWCVFARENYPELLRYATSMCVRFGFSPTEAEDVVQDSLLDAMGATIRMDPSNSPLRYVMRVVRNKVLTKVRQRRVHAITVSALCRTGEDPAFWETFAAALDETGIDRLLTACELRACVAAFLNLPEYVEEEFSSAQRNIKVVMLKNLMGLSYEQVASEMGVDNVQRKWAERGRELLRGWISALCGTADSGSTKDSRYWTAGYRAGIRFKEDQNWRLL